MGTLGAQAMVAAVNDGLLDHQAALHWHLGFNHYPPVPGYMVPVAQAAIDFANAGDWDAEIEPPAGGEWNSDRNPTTTEIVEDLHLDSFINYLEDL